MNKSEIFGLRKIENKKLQNFTFWLPEQILTERLTVIRFFSFTLQTWTVDYKPEVKVTPCKEYKLFFSLLFNIGVLSLVLYAIYELN